jgi:hypothetical protein
VVVVGYQDQEGESCVPPVTKDASFISCAVAWDERSLAGNALNCSAMTTRYGKTTDMAVGCGEHSHTSGLGIKEARQTVRVFCVYVVIFCRT